MKRFAGSGRFARLAVVACLACLAIGAHARDGTPELLLQATHCLGTKDEVPVSAKHRSLRMAYVLDTASYAPERVLYVVRYTGASRVRGEAFAMFLTEQDGAHVFNLQNNATFVPAPGEASGPDFPDPPLGGTWTQRRLAAAIRQIGKERVFAIPVGEARASAAAVRCESYTDPQA